MRYLLGVLCLICSAQTDEITVSKDSIFIQAVRGGSMPLRVAAEGSVTSTNTPPTVTATLPVDEASVVRAGQPATARVAGIEITSRVVALRGTTAHLELARSLPTGTVVGTPALIHIQYSEIENTLFVARPVDMQENAEATVFRIDVGERSATRVRVRYGRAAAHLIQILDGVAAGDHIIASDTRAWSGHPRIRLE
jgi:hypothetical protein